MNDNSRRIARIMVALGIVIAALMATSGCALSPNRLPSVKAGVSNDYEVTLKFASVLNLPTGADVMMNGLQVGRVTALNETADGVDVVVGLTKSRPVPANSSAVIRQNTPLGDTYLGLTPDTNAVTTEYLRDGSVIPQERTTSPPTLEDTIAVLAYFVNGGTIQKVQDTMGTLNKVLPKVKDVRRLATTVAKDLDDLADNTDEIDRTLTGLDNVAKSFPASATYIEHVFSAGGVHYFETVAYTLLRHIATLLPSVGKVFTGGLWASPLLNSLADTLETAKPMWPAGDGTLKATNSFLGDTLLPFLKNPKVTVTSVKASGSNKQLLGDTITVLRILGVLQ
ncbi:MlaD family protein [Gordonia sp. (in: high G+C Gram-positive bacteria)]|jgi:virulence factor Mce-like protein|uniref:MlaD family protein n=2 Tax=Gordonia sp. (in: high G+C Gram-positive bacteria) TaxID=84139 RepID=UPI002608E09F|nr:MlaD family protein [Gordonia sp. (in: high G+C Gram-positive bacteria)]HMS76520.1 MlaD family protein [Gordonia sp. (in: high G+C Gram-positive bacteria)]HQV17355.1 MlaD family protein [Gordonia sp. (in: high G+C Gram-positive bacteria)]